jgi:hypothetical protein
MGFPDPDLNNLNSGKTIYHNHNNFACAFPDCSSKDIEYYTTVWINKHTHVLVFHWCGEHVPENATYILQDDDSWWNEK